jgi:hypothetical protein
MSEVKAERKNVRGRRTPVRGTRRVKSKSLFKRQPPAIVEKKPPVPVKKQVPALSNRSTYTKAQIRAYYNTGRSLLRKLVSKAAAPAWVATVANDAYSQLKNTSASQAKYESMARKIAKESAAIKSPPKRGNTVTIAGNKVKLPSTALKDLKSVEVKPRAMDKPAKAKEPEGDRKTVKELSFGQAFAAARKAGKKTFMFKGEPFHTRTAEEEAKNEKKAVRRRKLRGGTTAYGKR